MLKQDYSSEILLSIRKIIRSFARHSKKLHSTFGFTGPQMLVLNQIRSQRITTSEVAHNINLGQPTVTSLVDKLVEKGIVDRVRDSVDKRRWFLELSDYGKTVFENPEIYEQQQFIKNFNDLPEWKQTQLLSSLQHVASLLATEFNEKRVSIISTHLEPSD